MFLNTFGEVVDKGWHVVGCDFKMHLWSLRVGEQRETFANCLHVILHLC